MPFPVVGKNAGSGIDQLKATIMGWIRDEIRSARRGGIGIAPQEVYDTAGGFGLSPVQSVIKTTTITVPLGMTSAVVSVVARILAFNPNTTAGADGGGADYLYGRVTIDGTSGVAMPLVIRGLMSSDISVNTLSTVIPGLVPGSTFDIVMSARTDTLTWAAKVANTAELSGIITWYR